MRVSTWRMAALLWLSCQQLGCSEDVRFDPSGCDVQVRGTWTVDDQVPSKETCDEIALVELAIINDEEDEFWSGDELLLRCDIEQDDGGAYLNSVIYNRDRCGGSGEVLENREGPYKYRWRAITDLNFIVDCSPILSQEIEPGGAPTDGGLELALPPVNFVTADGGTLCPEPN